MNHFGKVFSLLIVSILLAFNCKAGDEKNEYKTDLATGVKYLYIKHDAQAAKPVITDIAYVRIVYKRDDDSLLFDSHAGKTDSTSIIPLSLQKSFRGSLEDAITLMASGDSASFLISTDSIYLKAFKLKEIPPFVKAHSYLKFYIKLVRFETLNQMKDEQYALLGKHKADAKKSQAAEAASIQKYLANNDLKIKPLILDSLYILQRTGTIGKEINDGDTIEIKYTGMLLDGTIFDQSDKGDGGKGTYKFQYKHNAQLIRGWIEVLATMHEGEKVRFLLPSSVGYGPSSAGKDIKPYSTLLFEIEVVKVISPFDK